YSNGTGFYQPDCPDSEPCHWTGEGGSRASYRNRVVLLRAFQGWRRPSLSAHAHFWASRHGQDAAERTHRKGSLLQELAHGVRAESEKPAGCLWLADDAGAGRSLVRG